MPVLPIWNQWTCGRDTRVSSLALSARRYHKPKRSTFGEIICVSFQQAESAEGRHIWSSSRRLFARRRTMEKCYQLNTACRTAVTVRYGYCTMSTKTSFLFYYRALSVVSWIPRTYTYECVNLYGFPNTPPSNLDACMPDGVFNAAFRCAFNSALPSNLYLDEKETVINYHYSIINAPITYSGI